MPHVIVKLWSGKSDKQKTRLAEEITKAVMTTLNYGEELVSVAMEEYRAEGLDRESLQAGYSCQGGDPLQKARIRSALKCVSEIKYGQGTTPWKSNATVRSRPARDRRTISPARCASTRCSRRPTPARVRGASVTFEPGARTAWHTHPLGQTLIVTAGLRPGPARGGPVEEIRPGDVVWFSPGEKHWHGASPTTAMTHIAIQEALDGKVVDWMEHVSDEQYRG